MGAPQSRCFEAKIPGKTTPVLQAGRSKPTLTLSSAVAGGEAPDSQTTEPKAAGLHTAGLDAAVVKISQTAAIVNELENRFRCWT